MEPDFSGWATKADILCTDGRIIHGDAFKHQDKTRVPLVWKHQHDGLDNQLGFAVLEHRDGGMYTYGYFNDTPAGRKAKSLLEHGEISMLSIFADGLTEQGSHVEHGDIQEVSLVRLGANKGAVIDNVYLKHEDTGEYEIVREEAIITTGLALEHENKENIVGEQKPNEAKSVQEVWDSMTEEQQKLASAVGVMLAEGSEDDEDVTNEDGTVTHADGSVTQTDGTIKHADGSHTNADGTPVVPGKIKHQEGAPMGQRNAFEGDPNIKHDGEKKYGGLLSHGQLTTILTEAKDIYGGSFKRAVLAHADDYGITNIDLLFPDAKSLNNMPDFVKRRTEWVSEVITGTSHTPFTRIKTLTADITHDEARAKGYIKGSMKKDEFFGLKKRVTTPATVYKKQKLDRDDLLDVTEYDVVAWLWLEMRIMIEEELARAILFGDGREVDDEDKIKEPAPTAAEGAGIRSIANDDEFYAHQVEVPANISAQDASELVIRSFENYRGSGNTTMFTSRGFYVDMLLAKDKMNRRLYSSPVDLAAALGVNKIVPVDLMKEYTEILAIIVDLRDYSVGTDKGGDLTKFDDFDIDFNQYKYLIETRLSGALTKWKSALVFRKAAGTAINWDNSFVPSFVPATGVVTIPNKTGVVYTNADTDAVLTPGAQNAIAAGSSVEIEATAAEGYYLPYNLDNDWTFERPSV